MAKVLDFLLPKEEQFYQLLIAQSTTSVKTAEALEDLVRRFNDLENGERLTRIRHIRELEAQGDRETHALIDKLHTSFITPIDREDIHELAVLLDDLIDYMDNVGKKLAQFHVKHLPDAFIEQIAISHRAILEVHAAVENLKGSHIKEHLVKIHDLEEEADVVFGKAIEELFSKPHEAIEVIKLKDLYETAEAIPDNCQAVAVLLEGIVVKHA